MILFTPKAYDRGIGDPADSGIMGDSLLNAVVSYWRELRRRRVVRVALAYGAVGFGVMEVADTFFPALRLPDWSVTLVALLVLLGFPVAMVLAWVYEITSDGLQRTDGGAGGHGAAARPIVALVLLALLPIIAATVWAYRSDDSSYAADPVGTSASSIAILPFRYSGGADHAYLGEGIVDLLTTKVDKVAGLHAVDPAALFGVLSELDDNGNATPAVAATVARRLGVSQYVVGSITEVGTRLQIRALLYGPGGEVLASAEAVAESEEAVLEAVDETARELMAPHLGRRGGELVELAALTSRSMSALRAYLEGERLLRKADGMGAAEAFERAVREDSLFALAHYALSVAREWGGAGSPDAAASRALALRDRLPAQQRALLDAYNSYMVGDHPEAEAAYRAILQRTPNDVAANYAMAEVIFHYAPLSGKLPEDAEPAFRKVLRFQPDHVPSLYHLTSIAVANGDLARLDSLTDRVATLGSPFTFDLRAQQAFAHADTERVDSVIRELASPAHAAQANLGFLAFRTRNVPALKALSAELAKPTQSEVVRARGRRWEAFADFAAGRLRSARATREAAPDDPLLIAQSAYLAAVPFTPARPDELRSLRAKLLELSTDDVDLLSGGGSVPGEVVRQVLLGLLSARLGDGTEARRRAAAVGRAVLPPQTGTHATDLRMEILALSDYLDGRPEAALATLEAMPLRPGLVEFAFVPWIGLGIARLLRAELLADAQRYDEARRWFEAAGEGSYIGAVLRAPAHLGLARVHDRTGDRQAAADHYARFIELWKDSDPDLQPQVYEARQRLAELAQEG